VYVRRSALISAPEESAAGTVFARYGMLHYIRCTFADGSLLMEAIPVASVIDDVTYLEMRGAPHYLEGHRPEAMAHVAEWLAKRFP